MFDNSFFKSLGKAYSSILYKHLVSAQSR